MRWIGAVLLGALVIGLVALRPAQAARTLDCRPGARHNLEGVGPPRTALLLLFDGEAIGGGVTAADGSYRIPLVVGAERPGAYPVAVVRRDNRAVIDTATCIVPSPGGPTSPRAAATNAPATNAPATTVVQPSTTAAATSTRSTSTPTATSTSTVSPSPSATLAPGQPSPTATPTGSPTATASATALVSSPTTQAGTIVLDLDDLDTVYYVDDDIDVVGTLINTDGDGVPNIAVTVRFTINGADQGIWCTTTTDVNGDWECPTKTVPSAWLNKDVRITATAIVQGRTLTDSDNFSITPD